jgi:hypothetical protein
MYHISLTTSTVVGQVKREAVVSPVNEEDELAGME